MGNMESAFIYGLRDNRTGAIRYVGKTTASLADRLDRHLWAARRGMRQYVCNWIRSAGYQVSIVQLESLAEGAGLDQAEQRWIAAFRDAGARLTNIRAGGEGGGGFALTQEQRAKIAAANRRRFADPAARERIAEANRTRERVRGWKHSDLAKDKCRAANAGKPKSLAGRAAMSAAAKRRLQNPEQRQQAICRVVRPGVPLSAETKRKISVASKGRPKSAETRARMKAAWVLRRASA